MCLFRYPRFRFRPSHADALHVDLWIDGENHLRDGGSFSYADIKWHNYFTGTASHNTIQFDERDQMPRLSRFLFGNWLKTSECGTLDETEDAVSFRAGYRDSWRASHHREAVLGNRTLRVTDRIDGFRDKAVLRWRLQPGDWHAQGNLVTDGNLRLSVEGSVDFQRFEVVEGWESRHYLQKTALPVLEVEVSEAAVLETTYSW